MDIPNEYIRNLYRAVLAFLVLLSLFFAVKVLTEFRTYNNIGGRNTISLSGHGEVQAVPDIAGIYFSIESSKSTQGAASEEVNNKTKKVLDFLKSSGVEDKDIKTENYSSYPKYSYPQPCPTSAPNGIMMPCIQTETKIVGYTVSQSINVKVRKVDDASKIIDGINKIGVSNMSGPNLTIDDEDALKNEARAKAIADAKAKAKILAKDLGVHLSGIQSFNESGNYPIYYSKSSYGLEGRAADATSVAPSLPVGQNTISVDVSITYEIR